MCPKGTRTLFRFCSALLSEPHASATPTDLHVVKRRKVYELPRISPSVWAVHSSISSFFLRIPLSNEAQWESSLSFLYLNSFLQVIRKHESLVSHASSVRKRAERVLRAKHDCCSSTAGKTAGSRVSCSSHNPKSSQFRFGDRVVLPGAGQPIHQCSGFLRGI